MIPALKAPPQASPGQRPGARNRSVRPERAEESSALSGRKMYSDTFPGRCPGWHALRRWRVIVAEFSTVENCYEVIYERASSQIVVRSVG
jgi:hypothetical protein